MRHRSLVLIASLLVTGLVLGGCSTFDPTEWFSTKKPLPGERKDVFPSGVPGVAQGVPPELVEGYRPPVEPVPEPLPIDEKPKARPVAKPKPKPRPTVAAAPRPQQPQQQQAAPQQGGQAPWPAAPAQGQPAQAQGVFPDPPRATR